MSTLSNKIVLTVDEKSWDLSIIKVALKDHYKVFGVKSAIEALEFMNKQRVNLFILETEMPYIDGYDLALLIRMDYRYTETPIIFLSEQATRGHVIASMEAGGNDFIIKPIDHAQFLAKVKSFLV